MKKLNLRKEDGSLNWKFIIIGTSWKKFLITTFWFIAVLMMAYGYKHDTEQCMDVYANPCNYCEEINFDKSKIIGVAQIPKINFSNLNITNKNEREKKTGEDPSAP